LSDDGGDFEEGVLIPGKWIMDIVLIEHEVLGDAVNQSLHKL